MCTNHLWDDPTGLTCQRTDPHASGHIYETSDGSAAVDNHLLTEGNQS